MEAHANAAFACDLLSLTREEFINRTAGIPRQIAEDIFGPLFMPPPR